MSDEYREHSVVLPLTYEQHQAFMLGLQLVEAFDWGKDGDWRENLGRAELEEVLYDHGIAELDFHVGSIHDDEESPPLPAEAAGIDCAIALREGIGRYVTEQLDNASVYYPPEDAWYALLAHVDWLEYHPGTHLCEMGNTWSNLPLAVAVTHSMVDHFALPPTVVHWSSRSDTYEIEGFGGGVVVCSPGNEPVWEDSWGAGARIVRELTPAATPSPAP